MTKRILQDVVTSSRVNQDAMRRRVDATDINNSSPNVRMPSADRSSERYINRDSNGRPQRFAIWAVAAAAVAFLFFVLLSFFSGTVVSVTPLQKRVTVDESFVAQKKAEENQLSFRLIVLEETISGEVVATGEKEVEKKASGNIVIFNEYSSKSQKLIKRTRFETPEGNVYRIDKSIIVPGTTVENGKVIPGSVEVTVYADIPGEEYNVGLTDFTIPGFKGDPRFDKFYARSKTPIKDGFSGTIKIAAPEDVTNIKKGLQNSLKETLLEQARADVPGDFILYDEAVFFSFEDLSNITEATKSSIEVKEKGILYGVLLNRAELSKNIAQDTITTYDNSDVLSPNLEELKFSLDDTKSFNPEDDTKFNFNLSGESLIVWEIDETSIARDLAGIEKIDFLKIIGEYPNVQKAEATIKPFWKKTFPKNSEDITIRKIKPSIN